MLSSQDICNFATLRAKEILFAYIYNKNRIIGRRQLYIDYRKCINGNNLWSQNKNFALISVSVFWNSRIEHPHSQIKEDTMITFHISGNNRNIFFL